MSIETEYTGICDKCDRAYEHGFSQRDRERLLEILAADGWSIEPNVAYDLLCPRCAKEEGLSL